MHVVGRRMALKEFHILILGTCESITIPGKKDSAEVIILKTLRWGDFPELSVWAQCNHQGPKEGRTFPSYGW